MTGCLLQILPKIIFPVHFHFVESFLLLREKIFFSSSFCLNSKVFVFSVMRVQEPHKQGEIYEVCSALVKRFEFFVSLSLGICFFCGWPDSINEYPHNHRSHYFIFHENKKILSWKWFFNASFWSFMDLKTVIIIQKLFMLGILNET